VAPTGLRWAVDEIEKPKEFIKFLSENLAAAIAAADGTPSANKT
jgi:hypothetical protein